jgi:hypothetical protein
MLDFISKNQSRELHLQPNHSVEYQYNNRIILLKIKKTVEQIRLKKNKSLL